MSPLTKVFVVLLVVLSLLLTAASVTFVYSVDNYQVANTGLKQQVEQLTARASGAEAAAGAEIQAMQSRLSAATARISQLEESLKTQQQQYATGAASLATAQVQASQLNAQLASEKAKSDALVASNDRLFQQLNEYRNISDKNVKQNAELSLAVSDLTNKYQTTEQQRRNLAEQLQEAKVNAEKQTALLRQYNIPTDAVAKVTAKNINGLILKRTEIANVPYATISVGSQAEVAEGMEFSVIDQSSGAYLGTITITKVDPNQAIGRIKGDRIGDVKAGNEVRTQL